MVDAVGDADDVVVVAHSFGAFTAPLVAARRAVSRLVLVAGMVPSPGEPPSQWWTNTGHAEAVREQAAVDAGLTGNEDPRICYYHDVPEALTAQSLSRERAHPSDAAYTQPWPLDRWPDVPTRFVLCTRDRLFPAGSSAGSSPTGLGITPDELDSGHYAALAHPRPLVDLLIRG